MKDILLRVPDQIKAKLDLKRAEGYSMNGFLNAVLARELAETPTKRTPSRPRKDRRGNP